MANKFTNSPLATYVKISPYKNSPENRNQRTEPISKITIHHMAGVGSVEAFGEIVTKPGRNMSANYAIGNDGRIGRYLEESDRAWTSNSKWNDQRAITIEVSNSKTGDPWPISDAAWKSMIALCVDICKRNGIKKLTYTGDKNGSLTFHRFYAATGCVPVDSTEVLTRNGWVNIGDIKIGDEIATANPNTCDIKFDRVENLVPIRSDDVYTVYGMSVTRDHRVVCKTDTMKFGYDFIQFNDLNHDEFRIPSAGHASQLGLSMTSSEMIFLLEAQRIGVINKDNQSIEFSYVMESRVAYFQTLLTNIGYKYTKIHEDLGPVKFIVDDERAMYLIAEYLSGKDFNWKWLNMSPTQFSYFIYKVTSHENGTWRRTYQSDSILNINVVQALCAINDRGSYYDAKENILYVSEPYRNIERAHATNVDSGIDVTCITVPSGAFLMRQNGYTTITGNCPGPYIFSRAQQICDDVNAQLNPTPTPTPEPTPTVTIKTGDLVKISSGAVYYGTTSKIPSWVTDQRWYVTSVSGSRVVLGKSESGISDINSAVDAKYLTVIENASAPIENTFKPYTKSLTKGTTVYTITNNVPRATGSIQTTGVYTITNETVISNVKYGYLKSGAGWVNLGQNKTSAVDTTIRVGDYVKVLNPVTYDGKSFKVYASRYKVLEVKGDRIVISSDGKNVTAAVNAKNLRKV